MKKKGIRTFYFSKMSFDGFYGSKTPQSAIHIENQINQYSQNILLRSPQHSECVCLTYTKKN